MSGTWKINPEWEQADYELRFGRPDCFLTVDGFLHRFKEPPPLEIWENTERLREWIKEHSIAPLVEKT